MYLCLLRKQMSLQFKSHNLFFHWRSFMRASFNVGTIWGYIGPYHYLLFLFFFLCQLYMGSYVRAAHHTYRSTLLIAIMAHKICPVWQIEAQKVYSGLLVKSLGIQAGSIASSQKDYLSLLHPSATTRQSFCGHF